VADQDALRIEPLTTERWPDLERLFGPKGAVGGCWCMWFRETRAEYRARAGRENREALHAIVETHGLAPGLLAYDGDRAVGWVSLAPREEYVRLARSRTAKRIDDTPVWSIVCFFIDTEARGRGVMHALVAGAIAYAREHGARVLEAYPQDTEGRHPAADAAFVGLLNVFERAGFVEVARQTANRPLVRLTLE
jgi:GNAT superfamily N-acetyltransferase